MALFYLKTITMNLLKIIALLSILPLLAFQHKGWESYTYFRPEFSIAFPHSPTKERTIQPLGADYLINFTVSCSSYDLEGIDSNSLYMATCLTHPKEILSTSNPEELEAAYDRMIDNAVDAIDGKLLYNKEITQGGIVGRQAKILFNKKSLGGKNVSRIRYYIVQDKIYVIQTITLPQNDNNSYIDKFMDSFEFTGEEKVNKTPKKL